MNILLNLNFKNSFLIALILGIIFNFTFFLLTSNQKLQFAPLESKFNEKILSNNLLKDGEIIIAYQTLSNFNLDEFIVITQQRIIYKNPKDIRFIDFADLVRLEIIDTIYADKILSFTNSTINIGVKDRKDKLELLLSKLDINKNN
jgi:hypothetical protein